MVRRPKIISKARSIAISSNTFVIPPVGTGNAEVIRSSSNAIVRLFASNTFVRSPRVFVPGASSQVSKLSLKG